jgi:hypothetical protein
MEMAVSREERLQVMLAPDEVQAVDDFRFKTRMPSRAAAIRELLKRGLAAEGFTSASAGAHSSEYGVVSRSPDNRSDGAGRSGISGNGSASKIR